MSAEDRGPWMQTFTGRQFFPFDPHPEDVDIEDIAHALAHQCRFAGHSLVPYSVAEHSVRVAREVERQGAPLEVVFAALLHDASEAYLVDLPTPIKSHPAMGAYYVVEARVQTAIHVRLGVLPEFASDQRVKDSDLVLLATEARDLMRPPPAPWSSLDGTTPLKTRIEPWPHVVARRKFRDEFVRLTTLLTEGDLHV